MALRIYYNVRQEKEILRSGDCYSFRYTAFENDPEPLILFLNGIYGLHPNTGHQWRLIQGINLNYIPRAKRKEFVKVWRKVMSTGKSFKVTWQYIKRTFPFVVPAIRRYLLFPRYYIRNVKYIPPDKYDDEIVRSWWKDFSKIGKRRIYSKIKKMAVGSRYKK